MSWTEAYLLWNLGNAKLLFGLAAGTIGVFIFINWVIVGAIYMSYDETSETLPRAWKNTKKVLVWGIVALFISLFIPSTETMLKIVATKKGVDAIQSNAVQGYVNKSASIVDHSLELLDKTITEKLTKTDKVKK